jgi:spore coat polysaccharide biosynthesis protein SpsF
MTNFKTEQESFWAGEFGDQYINRNENAKILAGNISLFSHIFRNTRDVNSVIEFGPNVGLNLRAIKILLSSAELSAVEINSKAAAELKKIEGLNVYNKSILDFTPDYERDFVLIKGVLIHINPDMLPLVYDLLYRTSGRYICIAEYYNPVPVSLPYRGHRDKLFKRDFAGELLDRFSKVKLVDYGFTYHRDNYYDYDDLNWFLLEKC